MKTKKLIVSMAVAMVLLGGVGAVIIGWQKERADEQKNEQELSQKNTDLQKQLGETVKDFEALKNSDQLAINKNLKDELEAIKQTYGQAIGSYEKLVDLKGDKKQFGKLDTYFVQTLSQLSKANYASATATLANLDKEIKTELAKQASASGVQAAKSPSGQTVKTSLGDFTVQVISADLKTTKVVVDTASDHDCSDNCPVMPLADYAKRSGAWAAINGPYFCPASYPACSAKKNSFDTLLMNKNKTYFNSDNNVYSSVPAAIFSTTSRFVSKSQEWGRDTGVDSVIAGQPLLVFNGQSQFSGDGDPKKSGKGTRAFIGGTDSTVYIGLVYNATVAEMATVVASMGIKNAINLDSGGSIAMWNNGRYLAGPGRDLPFGIMLVRR